MSRHTRITLTELAAHVADGRIGSTDREAQCVYWYDWFCSDTALPAKSARLAKQALWVTKALKLDPDAYFMSLKNCCPMDGRFYDVIRLFPLDDNADVPTVIVTPKSGHTSELGQASLYVHGGTFDERSWSALKVFIADNAEWLLDPAEHEIRGWEEAYTTNGFVSLSDEQKAVIRARHAAKAHPEKPA